MSRSTRSAYTFLSNGLFSVVTMFTGLIAARLLVNWLGKTSLGTYAAGFNWILQISLIEIGFSGAMLPVLAPAVARNDAAGVRELLAASFHIYRRLTGLALLCCVVLIVFITHVMTVPPALVGDLRLGLLIGSIGVTTMLLSPLRAFIEASQRAYYINLLLIVQSLFVTGLSVLLAYRQWGVTGQFVATSAGVLLFMALVFRDVRRRVPGLVGVFFMRPSAGALEELRRLNGPTLIQGVSSRLSLFTDGLIINYFLGPEMGVVFMYTQKLANIVQAQLQSIGVATWAAMAELHLEGHHELLSQRIRELTRLLCVLGAAAAIPIIVFNRFFFHLWQPSLAYGGQWLTILAVVNAAALGVITLWGWVFSGTGRVAQLVPNAVVGAMVNLAISIIATKYGLMFGPVLGSTIGLVVVQLVWRSLDLRREFGVPLLPLHIAILGPALLSLPFIFLGLRVSAAYPPQGWVQVALSMAIVPLPYLGAAWIFVFGAGEKFILRQRVVGILSRAKSARAAIAPA